MTDKIVTIYLTRHAESTANYNSKFPNENIPSEKFKNSGLSPYGLDSVVYWRNQKLEQMNNVDYIFTSPLKRALETCLMTYNVKNINKPIYVLSLLTEFCENIDCEGDKIPDIKTDLDIACYINSCNLDFDKYFWLNNPNKDTGDWSKLDFRYDLYGRTDNFFELIKNDDFTDKTIAIYAHGGIVSSFLKIGAENYQTFKFKFNQVTGEKFDLEYL